MRRLLCLGIAAAAMLAIPTAQAVQAPNVSLAVSSFQVRYGDPVHLTGQVSNHKAGVPISVLARSFTRAGFARIATVMTGPKGSWVWDARPGIATTYQARTGNKQSRALLVGVRPAVTVTQLTNGRVRVVAIAQRSFAGRSVKVWELSSGRWLPITQLRLNSNSEALVPAALVPNHRTTMRATMSVNQSGSGYLGGFSPPIVLPARWVSISVSSPTIAFGDSLRLSGRVSSKQSGMALTILARPSAQPEFQPVATLTTGAGGRWSFQTHPRIGTAYQAQFAGTPSRIIGVGVHPTARVHVIGGGRVWTKIGTGSSLKGRDVQVQQLVEGQWRTIAKMALNANNVAVFPASKLPGGTSTLRVTMSVNQAGTGLLGAFSRPFVYQR
jgi:hypothetical protein